MMESRRLGSSELIRILEFHGPTHDADWMLPGVSHSALAANASWLCPDYYMPITNRLVFSFQIWLLKAGANIVLIDTGVGNCKHRPAPAQNMINTPVLDWFRAIGVPPERVTHVVQTHLHGDHVGWNTRWEDGRWVPTFQNATYYLPELDWCACDARYRAGEIDIYGGAVADSVVPIVDAGLARFLRAGDQVADCLTALPAPGHTPGHLVFLLRDGSEEFLFTGDVLHSPMQVLDPLMNSRWCEDAHDARASRVDVLRRAARNGATIIPAHAKSLRGWRVSERDGRFSVEL
jgi:glyoxylase-like metal-dependent hydrolase (beta-lactamase superfamily II)